MKVLHVNNVANVPDGLVKGLRNIGVDADLYQPYTGINRKGPLRKLGVVTNRIADSRILTAKVRKDKYDIVHIHYAYFGVLGVLGGYHYWLHCHGTDIRRNLYHPAFKTITKMSLGRADRVLYSTPDLKVHADVARPDAVFLPNPIQTELFEPSRNESPRGKILLISRIDPVKGTDIALRALEKIKARHPGVSIDAFAWGCDLDKYKGKDFVRFIPTVSHAGIAELLPQYQIIVGQFALGIMGMSEMEAMACGRPVISHFTYQNWYAEAPPLIQAQTEDEIEAQIEELLVKPSLGEDIGAAGREWVVRYHDYVAVAQRLAAMYEHELGAR